MLALLRASLTQKELQHRAGFNPAQARDPNGQWTAGGSSSAHIANNSVPDKTLLDEGGQDPSSADPSIELVAGSADADYTVDLQQQDALGGHGFRDHVAQSPKVLVDEVEAKARRERDPNNSDGWAEGSFTDKYNANYLVNTVLRNNKEMVDLVRSGQIPELILRERMGYVTGYEAYKSTHDTPARIRPTFGVRVLIRPSRQSPTGYYVHTAFPMNMGPGGQ